VRPKPKRKILRKIIGILAIFRQLFGKKIANFGGKYLNGRPWLATPNQLD
jgi:hypothetical protein